MDTPRSITGTRHHLHAIVRDTILGVEQVLLDLPQLGDKVEVTTTTERKAPPGQRTTRDVVLPETSVVSTSTGSERHTVNRKEKAELIPGSVCVNELSNMVGVVIDVAVKVTSKQSGTRLVLMTIECPEFVPRRLKYDNKWYSIT